MRTAMGVKAARVLVLLLLHPGILTRGQPGVLWWRPSGNWQPKGSPLVGLFLGVMHLRGRQGNLFL